jgi:hypothetical protein
MHPRAATCHRGTETRLPAYGGLRRCHVSEAPDPSPLPKRSLELPRAQRLWTCPTIQEGSSVATCPSAPNLASSLRTGLALTRVLRLRTAPASEVGSGADTCDMALHMLWDVEIKEDLAAMTYVFSRLACFQDTPVHYQAACKMCRQMTLS